MDAGPIATLTDPDDKPDGLSVAFSPDGAMLAAGDGSGSTYLRNAAHHNGIAALAWVGNQYEVAFGSDGTMLAAADSNGSTYLWSVATRKLIATRCLPR